MCSQSVSGTTSRCTWTTSRKQKRPEIPEPGGEEAEHHLQDVSGRRTQDLAGRTDAKTVQAGAKAVQGVLEGARNTTQGVIATIFGLITLLFGASGVLVELHDGLNTIWEVPPPKLTSSWERIASFVRERLFSLAVVLATGFLLLVSLAVNAWIAGLEGPFLPLLLRRAE